MADREGCVEGADDVSDGRDGRIEADVQRQALDRRFLRDQLIGLGDQQDHREE